MINNTCGFERMSFMDGFSGYNQIKIYSDDKKHTSFRTPLVYCYTVMPFRLKHTGATYQRAMNAIFHEHVRKTVESYVDDIAVKSRAKGDHITDLKVCLRHHAGPSIEDEPHQILHGGGQWQIPRVCHNLHRNSFGSEKGSCYPGDATSEKPQRA